MSFLIADAVAVRRNPTSINMPTNIDSMRARDNLSQEPKESGTQRVASEHLRKNELVGNEEDDRSPDVAPSHSSSRDSHLPINERIDELDESRSCDSSARAFTDCLKHY